jgi:formylglycine-generating enzyme required for sulfatase activity
MRRFLPPVRLAFLLALALPLPCTAQTAAGKKHALLVGVRTYSSGKFEPLRFTENDVEDLAVVLKEKGGFTSLRVLSTGRGEKSPGDAPTADNVRKAIKALLAKRERHDTILVALSGHGIQVSVKGKDESFFCPADAQLNDTSTLLNMSELLGDMDASGAAVKLLLVDACRNDPGAGRSVDADRLRPPRGTAALFSCKGGERAFETDKLGEKGHGVFFHHVIEGLKGKAKNKRGEVTWSRLADHVIESVSEDVPKIIGGGAKQTPEQKLNLTGRSPILVGPDKEDIDRNAAKRIDNSIGMRLVRIPAGTFLMGSPSGEPGRYADEHQHRVRITQAFYMGAFTVTQDEYEKLMGDNPSSFAPGGDGKKKVKGESTGSFPVESASWQDAKRFCEKLSALPKEKSAGRVYRLPTEAEWEYACRAETTTAFHFGTSLSSTAANFNLGRTGPVGSYKPNKFGLYDMHGNVWQWCADWYGERYYRESPEADPRGPDRGEQRVLRGGSWQDYTRDLRAAVRGRQAPDQRSDIIGFRVVWVPDEEGKR